MIEPCHLLLGILAGPRGVGYAALEHCGAEREGLRAEVLRRMPWERRGWDMGPRLPLSPRGWTVVRGAVEEAYGLGHQHAGTEHLVLALCADRTDGVVRGALAAVGVTGAKVRAFVVQHMRAIERVDRAGDASA